MPNKGTHIFSKLKKIKTCFIHHPYRLPITTFLLLGNSKPAIHINGSGKVSHTHTHTHKNYILHNSFYVKFKNPQSKAEQWWLEGAPRNSLGWWLQSVYLSIICLYLPTYLPGWWSPPTPHLALVHFTTLFLLIEVCMYFNSFKEKLLRSLKNLTQQSLFYPCQNHKAPTLAGVAQWTEHQPACESKVTPSWVYWRGNRLMFLSHIDVSLPVSPSLPLSL